jgi:DNA-binding response OmpR family regulator
MKAERILVVDDEAPLREMLADYLSAFGYVMETVPDGRAMRDEPARRGADLVILDVHLPGESGYDLAHEIAADDGRRILMLTAVGDLEHRLRGLAAGVDDYTPNHSSRASFLPLREAACAGS